MAPITVEFPLKIVLSNPASAVGKGFIDQVTVLYEEVLQPLPVAVRRVLIVTDV